MLSMFYEVIYPLFEKCFPHIKVMFSTREHPFMSPLVKHLLNRRKKATKKHALELSNRLQEKINSLIRENRMRTVRQESNNHKTGSKKWWKTVNSIQFTHHKKKIVLKRNYLCRTRIYEYYPPPPIIKLAMALDFNHMRLSASH